MKKIRSIWLCGVPLAATVLVSATAMSDAGSARLRMEALAHGDRPAAVAAPSSPVASTVGSTAAPAARSESMAPAARSESMAPPAGPQSDAETQPTKPVETTSDPAERPSAPPAESASTGVGSAAQCFVSADVRLSPGLGILPSSGTFTTGGETGTLSCYGLIKGQQITGPGPFAMEGSYGLSLVDTCLGGQGLGTSSFTLPTPGGSVRLSGTLSFTYSTGFAYMEVVGGDLSTLSGTAEYSPLTGDCVNAPMTSFRLVGQVTLIGP